MKTTNLIVLLWALNAVSGTFAQAACVGTSVHAFGAKGDGQTDDSAAIKAAIDSAAAAGGGAVVFNVARYYTSGSFVIPAGVVLCGTVEGPFDNGSGANPAVTAIAPTLLVTSTSAPFIILNGPGATVSDLLFHYPNQASASAASPKVYPYTIVANSPGTKVLRILATNAYNFLDIESGRVIAQDLFIGAYNIGVNVDHAHDHVTLRNLFQTVFWDFWDSAYPSAIDAWVISHGIALVINRADGLEVHNFFLYHRFAGMLLTDSPDATQNPRCGYGTGSDINFDTVQYGIIVSASNAPGYEFTNLIVGAWGDGQAVVQARSGGSLPPNVLINGGSERGLWAFGAFPAPATGHLTAVNIIGFDLP